jgi:hypothetical protein
LAVIGEPFVLRTIVVMASVREIDFFRMRFSNFQTSPFFTLQQDGEEINGPSCANASYYL